MAGPDRDAETDLLPYVGKGSNGSPVAADVDGDGTLEIGTASIGSPPYLLSRRRASTATVRTGSTSRWRRPRGVQGRGDRPPAFASLGGGAFGRLGAGRCRSRWARPACGDCSTWSCPSSSCWPRTTSASGRRGPGTYEPGLPRADERPHVLQHAGDRRRDRRRPARSAAASAMYDLRAYGRPASRRWVPEAHRWVAVATPGGGRPRRRRHCEVAYATREGNLFVWRTAATCQALEWPKYQHDLRNTGTYGMDAERPARVQNLQGPGIGRTIRWNATVTTACAGRRCPTTFRASASPITDANWGTATQLRNEPAPAAPGIEQTYNVTLPTGTWYVAMEVLDEAGNRSMISASSSCRSRSPRDTAPRRPRLRRGPRLYTGGGRAYTADVTNCPNCRTENADEARFCSSCGTTWSPPARAACSACRRRPGWCRTRSRTEPRRRSRPGSSDSSSRPQCRHARRRWYETRPPAKPGAASEPCLGATGPARRRRR